MNDQRKHARDGDISPAISCLLELPGGRKLDGVVIDISDTGARIAGTTRGLQIGAEYRIILVVQAYQKVAYQCVVRHINADAAFYGIQFASRPQIAEPDAEDAAGAQSGKLTGNVKRCPVDNRVFPVDYRYCPFDKSNLVLENC